MKDHIIESEEYFVVGEKKSFLSKRVYRDYIFYSPPYVENELIGKKLKDIFEFVDPTPTSKDNLYLNTRFDLQGNAIFYDTCHKKSYDLITEEGVEYFYNNICGFDEPHLIKKFRESLKECKLHKITVNRNGVVSSLTFSVRREDLLEFSDQIQFTKLSEFLSIFDSISDIIPSWFVKFDNDSNSFWLGFSDNISPETYIEEQIMPQYYAIDWKKVKETFYNNLVEHRIIEKSHYDYMMNITHGKQPTTSYFLLNNDSVQQIHFENMITYKFEDILEGA